VSSLSRQTRQLERVIRRKEKIFLMEQYAASMLQQLEPTADEVAADEQVVDALRIAYRYVNPDLGARLSALLATFGYAGNLDAEREAAEEAEAATFAEEEEEEEEEVKPAGRNGKPARKARTSGEEAEEGEEDEDAGVLFERDIYTGRKTGAKSRKPAGDGEDDDPSDLFADDDTGEGGADDLFADDEEGEATSEEKTRKGRIDDEGDDPSDLFADDDTAEGGADDLFADDPEGESETDPKAAKKGKTRTDRTDEEEEDTADLFAEEEESEKEEDPKAVKKKTRKGSSTDDEGDDPSDLFTDDDTREGSADDLFAEEDPEEEAEEDPKADKKKKARKGRDAEEEENASDLFADGEEEEPKAPGKKGKKARAQDEDEDEDQPEEGDPSDLFAEEDPEEEPKASRKKGKKGTAPTGESEGRDEAEADEENEDAGALFEQDIYTDANRKKKKKKHARRGAEDEGPDLEAEEEDSRSPRRARGKERRETPGFSAPEGAVERDERNRRGFAPVTVNPDAEEALESRSKIRPRPGRRDEEEEEEEEEETTKRKKSRGAGRAAEEEEEAEERKEAKPKREPRAATEEDKEDKAKKAGREAQTADPKAEEKKLNLDALAFQVSVEDLRTHMGITLVREDHVKLMRRWEQKSRDNSIRLLLDDPKATQHPYALIPRITRFIKDGQMIQVNVLNLVRHFFQLFENVPQVVQLKSEPFFVTEVPTLEWAIVACEALPDTLNKTVLEQRTIFGQYIQKFLSNERRVRRRVLVEALYDIIVLNMVLKEPILRKTVDLTETRRGRQQQMCVNFGAKGIRISSIARDQRHQQMGMCPSW